MKQLSCVLLFAAGVAAAQTHYTITDLGAIQAYGVNAAGDVAGVLNATTHAVRWSQGTPTDLGTLGGSRSYGLGINDSGQVTGWSQLTGDSLTRGMRWTGTSPASLGTLGGCCSYGQGINASGQVAGYSYLSGNSPTHAVRWTGTTPTDLGTLSGGLNSFGYGINASGQVAGYSSVSGGASHAVRWSGTTATDLGVVPGGTTSNGFAINASGQVVGFSTISNGRDHAVIWNVTTPTDLGTLPGGAASLAYGIDTVGNVVGTSQRSGVPGYHAFLWDHSSASMLDLNDLLVDGDNWVLTEARDINGFGQIVANGTFGGSPRAALLTPVTATDLTFTTTVSGAPSNLSVNVDGPLYVTPVTHPYTPGTMLGLFAPSPQSVAAGPGTQYVFHDWSDGGEQLHTISVQSVATTYTANFTTQYLLTTLVNPPGAGAVSPPTGFSDPGLIHVQATPSGCWGFVNWTGTNVTNGTINLTSPTSLQANFILNQSLPNAGFGSVISVRTMPLQFRRTVSATNILPFSADVSFILDTPPTTLVAPATPSGQTTICSNSFGTGSVGRNYYTVSNVPAGLHTSVTFYFTDSTSANNLQVSVITGPGAR